MVAQILNALKVWMGTEEIIKKQEAKPKEMLSNAAGTKLLSGTWIEKAVQTFRNNMFRCTWTRNYKEMFKIAYLNQPQDRDQAILTDL